MPALHRFTAFRGLLVASVLMSVVVADDLDQPNLAEGIEFFERKVRPLLIEHCYECHAGEEQSGGLKLDSRAAWMAGGDSGPTLVAGRADQSRLIEAVRYENLDLQMPPDGRMSDAEIAVLEQWVALGAPDPRNEASPQAKLASGMSLEQGRKFWSFLPLANPQVPKAGGEWGATPVDAFVAARLAQQGLQPAPVADKRTLIRRVTFDLIGLPPTVAEVDAFLKDYSDDAFERVVERLLNSPQYGERWGRHWLDVARYADSNGLDENLAYGNAWRYRDYVVNAFNADKPFDRFLIEQLAGDLLAESGTEGKTATGFLVLGAKVLAEPDRDKLLMDTIDEQIDATGKAFLGMTLGCVRCHDHKFDPLYQTDYYALAAIFKSTKTFGDSNTGAIKHWHEYSLATPQELQRLKEIDAAIAAKTSAASKFKNEAMAQLRSEAMQRAASYLGAATRLAPSATLNEVEAIAEPLGLHPRVLHHCRLHLEYNREDPFFSKWHEMVGGRSDATSVEVYFQRLFDLAAASVPSSPAKSPLEDAVDEPAFSSPEEEQLIKLAKLALNDRAGFLAVPPQPEFAFDQATLAQYYALENEARILESEAPDEPAVMGVAEGPVLVTLPIHIRGSHRSFGEPIAREFPQVMRTSTVRPVLPRNESGRLQLAQWMASSQHPLTARVYVNRVWSWHFGRGLVASTENFGVLGDRPTHPELLDWLARYFMESGWSTKALHRLLLYSSTYQMASQHPQAEQAKIVDPENRLLWKFRQQRLEAEQIRDALLAISGRLDETMGGKTVPLRNRQFVFNHTSVDHTKYDSLRRGLYLPVIRNNLYSFFEQFDFPDPTMPTGQRQATVVAPQALLLLNDELVMDAATGFARRVQASSSQLEARVEFAYQLALARSATPFETHRAMGFLAQVKHQVASKPSPQYEDAADEDAVDEEGGYSRRRLAQAELTAWSLFCQTLLISNEFVYLD